MTPSRPVIHSSRTDGTVEFTVSEVVAEVDGGIASSDRRIPDQLSLVPSYDDLGSERQSRKNVLECIWGLLHK
jgi:hypothetical protein